MSGFEVIPAIDLVGGRVVRLHQGDFAQETVFSDDPVALARSFRARGATRLHVVDLDGARAGWPVQAALIGAMAATGLRVQVGGGLRTLEAVEALFAAGGERAILGTVALRDPGLVREAARRWPGRIVVGLDARDGKVAVSGWLEASEVSPLQLASAFRDAGVAAALYTDISRDGTGHGPDVEGTAALARASGLPIIASGGVGSLDDLRRLRERRADGVVAVVVGKAILSGRLPLEEALALSVNSGAS